MIGTSILTVYQGHISEASLESGADVGRWLRSLDFLFKLSNVRARFLRPELILLFFLVPRPNLQHL